MANRDAAYQTTLTRPADAFHDLLMVSSLWCTQQYRRTDRSYQCTGVVKGSQRNDSAAINFINAALFLSMHW